MEEVRKLYDNMPAYEEVKIYIVRKTFQLNQLASKIQTFIMLERYDHLTFTQFRSEVINFYQYLRPKILNHDYGENNNEKNSYTEMCNYLDYVMYNPEEFGLEEAMTILNNLISFCEKDKLTSTKFYSGRGVVDGKNVYGD